MGWQLLLSDIHANQAALQAVLEDVVRLKDRYPVEGIWFCGDLVGYGPDVVPVLQRVQAWLAQPYFRWVLGNHDHEVAALLPHKTFPETPWTRGIHQRAWHSWRENVRALQQNPQAREKFASFVRAGTGTRPHIEVQGDWLLVMTHGSLYFEEGPTSSGGGLFNALTSYIFPWEDDHRKATAFLHPLLRSGVWRGAEDRPLLVLYGHTHIPSLQIVEKQGGQWIFHEKLTQYAQVIRIPPAPGVLINPGSVGQPRDGDRRAAYALLNLKEGLVMFRRVEYPVDELVEKMVPWGAAGAELARFLLEAPLPQKGKIPSFYQDLLQKRPRSP